MKIKYNELLNKYLLIKRNIINNIIDDVFENGRTSDKEKLIKILNKTMDDLEDLNERII